MNDVSAKIYIDMAATKKKLNEIKQLDVASVDKKNPGLTDELLDALN